MTYIIEMITPIGTSLLSYCITQPLQRYFASNGIMDRSSHSIVRQKDLNDLQNGPEFDPTVNTAELLLLTFFSMTFAAGIPIMMPLACVTFVAYFFVEKMLFLHYYKTPSHLDDGVTRVVLGALYDLIRRIYTYIHMYIFIFSHAYILLTHTGAVPWAAIIRCAFSCWIYGNKSIFHGIFMYVYTHT